MKLLIFPLTFQIFSVSSQSIIPSANETNPELIQQARTFGQIRKQVTGRLPDHFGQIAEKKGLINAKFATRNFLLRYGCYCFPNDMTSVGPRSDYHGPPKDDLDAICYKLFRAQKCLKQDHQNNNNILGNSCDVNQKYPIHVAKSGDRTTSCGPKKNTYSWIKDPVNQCQYKNCLLEKEFVEDIVDLLQNSNYQQNSKFETKNDEDYNNLCKNPRKSNWEYSSNGTLVKRAELDTLDKNENNNNNNNVLTAFREIPEMNQCCGTGIDRRPFNDAIAECCFDGTVKAFGLC